MNIENQIILSWVHYRNYYHYVSKQKFVQTYRLAQKYAYSKNPYAVFNYALELLKTERNIELNKL